MTWLDIGIVVALALGGWRGRRGFAREVCHIGSALLGIVVGYRIAPGLAETAYIRYGIDSSVGYVITFIVVVGFFTAVGIALTPQIDALLARWRAGRRLNQWGGILAGACKSALLLFVLVIAAVQVPWPVANRAIFHSPTALWMLRAAPAIYQTVQSIILDDAKSAQSEAN